MDINGITTIVLHDALSITTVLLDLKALGPSKNANSDTYCVQWYNTYLTINTLTKLSIEFFPKQQDII